MTIYLMNQTDLPSVDLIGECNQQSSELSEPICALQVYSKLCYDINRAVSQERPIKYYFFLKVISLSLLSE